MSENRGVCLLGVFLRENTVLISFVNYRECHEAEYRVQFIVTDSQLTVIGCTKGN